EHKGRDENHDASIFGCLPPLWDHYREVYRSAV
ncbi:MAG: hypothetical protein ACI8WY_004275, partial [Planctomycetota bacterium]